MKLLIATLTAATVLASTASAMVAPSNIDNRAAAQNALGFVTTGAVSQIAKESFALDGRSKALEANNTVTITTFQANQTPANVTDIR